MNILIVEDEEALAGALEHILQKAGHTTDWVADGQTALDYIRGFSYDLVLLDIMLPRLDGISVLRQVRTEGVQTPVLMLTARTTVPDKVKGLNAGADDYLTKPFDPEELLARVGAMTRRKGAMVLNEISYEDLPHVFDRFYRSDKSRTNSAGNFGLGLAITKEMVERLGGTISVTSSQEEGTVFSVTFG